MPLFITSTGTEQGKTYVTRLLCKQVENLKVIKPVLSGYEGYEGSDAAYLLEAMRKTKSDLNACTPWRFKAPLSPDLAAEREGKSIDYSELLAFCENACPDLIEGAGGVMSPLTKEKTNLDLIMDTKSEVVLVSSLYLGCISHILTALDVLRQRKVSVKGVVLSAVSPENMPSETILASLTPQLSAELSVFILPYLQNFDSDWHELPNLATLMAEQ